MLITKNYQETNYVQKGKIAKLLFLNIKIDIKTRHHIQVKPELDALFSPVWYSRDIYQTFFVQ